MLNYFLNLRLRIKLLLAFGSLLVLSAILMLKAFQTIRQSDHFQTTGEIIDGSVVNLLEMNVAINAFLSEGYKTPDFQLNRKSPELEQFQREQSELSSRYQRLMTAAITDKDTSWPSVLKKLALLNQHVQLLAGYLKERGFKDYGLEGELRKAIHAVETSSFPYDKSDMLMLRRHEKDFFLRKDLKYRDEFNKRLDEFEKKILSAKASELRDEMLNHLKAYRSQFNTVVKLEERIGLQGGGLRYQIQEDLIVLRKHAGVLRLQVKEEDKHYQNQAWTILTILFVILLISGLLLSIVYASLITRPIQELKEAISEFASGKLPQKLMIRSSEEIGQTKLAFNQLIDRIRAAQEFSIILGEGKLDTRYPETFQEDLMAQSLMRMQAKLVAAYYEQSMINWKNSGAAQLNEVLKAEGLDLSAWGDRLMAMVVKYLGANQGAMFIVQSSSGMLVADRIATYAYHKKKHIEQRIEAGHGLVGQCLLEKSTLVMNVVPPDYVKITSGLGEAVPRFLVIIPMKLREELVGIMELASFAPFENYQLEFLEKTGESIASILYEKKTSAETLKLLQEARQQAEQLASQEEEIRQNAEEMQAITEQLEREKQLLENELKMYQSMTKGTFVNH